MYKRERVSQIDRKKDVILCIAFLSISIKTDYLYLKYVFSMLKLIWKLGRRESNTSPPLISFFGTTSPITGSLISGYRSDITSFSGKEFRVTS